MVNLENASDATAPCKTFTYDAAYDFTTSTEVIYNDICYSLVEVRAVPLYLHVFQFVARNTATITLIIVIFFRCLFVIVI